MPSRSRTKSPKSVTNDSPNTLARISPTALAVRLSTARAIPRCADCSPPSKVNHLKMRSSRKRKIHSGAQNGLSAGCAATSRRSRSPARSTGRSRSSPRKFCWMRGRSLGSAERSRMVPRLFGRNSIGRQMKASCHAERMPGKPRAGVRWSRTEQQLDVRHGKRGIGLHECHEAARHVGRGTGAGHIGAREIEGEPIEAGCRDEWPRLAALMRQPARVMILKIAADAAQAARARRWRTRADDPDRRCRTASAVAAC